MVELLYFCETHADYVESATCARCRVPAFKITVPESASWEQRLSLPLGCCTECRAEGLTGGECWSKHFPARQP